jgi:hypothetical protein
MAKTKTSQLDVIRSLLCNSFIDKNSVLKEKGTTNKGGAFEMRRTIHNHRDLNYILFRFDPDKVNLFPYFNQLSGLKKICDYVMFVEEGSNLYILVIELKLGRESASRQLEASKCFIDFIMCSGKRIGMELADWYKIGRIRISEERSKKRNRHTKVRPLHLDENGIINYDHSDCFRIKEVLDALMG